MLGLAAASFFGAIVLQGAFGGAGFVPVSDRSEVNLIVETPPGSTLEYTRAQGRGGGRGSSARTPRSTYTYASIGTPIPLQAPGVDQALVYVRLMPKAERELSQDALGAILRRELGRVAGANISVFTSGFGGAFKSIQLELRGPDSRVLAQYAERVKAVAQGVPGAVDVGLSTRGQKPELEVELNRGLAGQPGRHGRAGRAVAPARVRRARRGRLGGPDRRDARRDGPARARGARARGGSAPAAARAPRAERRQPAGRAAGAGGDRRARGSGRRRSRTSTASASSTSRRTSRAARSSEVVQDIQKRLEAEVKLPPGYTLRQGGESARPGRGVHARRARARHWRCCSCT